MEGIETLAAGLPAVIRACGGPEEIVTEVTNAVVVPPQDLPALACAIADLLSDATRREQFRINKCQRLCAERFDVSAVIRAYAAVYERLV